MAKSQNSMLKQAWQKCKRYEHHRLENNNMPGINIRKQCLEHDNNMIRNISWQSKAWHEATQSIQQKSLTDHKPKGMRKYNCKHVNMAKTYSDLKLREKLEHANILTSRHVHELDALATEEGMTN